ncbi:MAG: hypothetical protein DRQ55_08800 [Planctomycetota bacterium]|nr:MAG: hypothetical protein DRQ55_08800 [Planctomycetota bacterium]
MRAARIGRLLAGFMLSLSLAGCAMFSDPSETPEDPTETEVRVYDLGEMGAGEFDSHDASKLMSMIRDAVGHQDWTRANSSMHILRDVLLIRTTDEGHDNLGMFFSQFRSINESP